MCDPHHLRQVGWANLCKPKCILLIRRVLYARITGEAFTRLTSHGKAGSYPQWGGRWVYSDPNTGTGGKWKRAHQCLIWHSGRAMAPKECPPVAKDSPPNREKRNDQNSTPFPIFNPPPPPLWPCSDPHLVYPVVLSCTRCFDLIDIFIVPPQM